MTVDTKERLISAAGTVLRTQGYNKSSARTIAKEAGVNSALVFYHFGGVDPLLFAALDQSSAERMAVLTEAVADCRTLEDLVVAGTRVYRHDLDAGHLTLFAELVAAAVAKPELREEIRTRAEPWMAFIEATLERVIGAPRWPGSPRRAIWPTRRSPSTSASTSSPCWTPTAPALSPSSRWPGGSPRVPAC
ncbi:TetR/AcrR family transcriptional regulator [Streptomyces stramineus]